MNGVTTSVETMYYNAIIGDLNVASETFTTIEFDTATTTAAGTDTITVAAGQTVILDSITDGDATDDTNNKGEVDITSASTVTSYAIEVQGVGVRLQQTISRSTLLVQVSLQFQSLRLRAKTTWVF